VACTAREFTVPFVRLVVTPSAAGTRDVVSAALFAAGAPGLQELDDSWVTVLTSSVDDAALLDALVVAARHADPAATVEVSELPVVDWSEAWRVGIRAHELGTLTVVPPWLAEGRDPACTIVIEPEMAFGTGEHETTRCVVRLMQGTIRGRDTVADLGAGSAVLAIAAAKLGATRVAAIEMDPDAIPNAESNVARNGVSSQVTVIEGDALVLLPLVAPVRVVLANILSSVLIEMLPTIAAAVPAGGAAILSGILGVERAMMLAAIGAAGGWRVDAEESEGEWWAVRLLREGWTGSEKKL
jgi:ribosomal protein L11 methyltransferase